MVLAMKFGLLGILCHQDASRPEPYSVPLFLHRQLIILGEVGSASDMGTEDCKSRSCNALSSFGTHSPVIDIWPL